MPPLPPERPPHRQAAGPLTLPLLMALRVGEKRLAVVGLRWFISQFLRLLVGIEEAVVPWTSAGQGRNLATSDHAAHAASQRATPIRTVGVVP